MMEGKREIPSELVSNPSAKSIDEVPLDETTDFYSLLGEVELQLLILFQSM